MANSRDTGHMKTFGRVMTSMMDDMISGNPTKAGEYIEQLESIRWKNYLTPREADMIVSNMVPKAPWTIDQWRSAMMQHGLEMEDSPCYNTCALWATMNMIMSDSQETLSRYVDSDSLFGIVHDLAHDKLTDEDGMFDIRRYFML